MTLICESQCFCCVFSSIFDTKETRSRSAAGASIGIANAENFMQSVSVVLDRNDIEKYWATNNLGEGYYTILAPKPKQEREQNAVDAVFQVYTSSGVFLQTENSCM